PEHAPIGAKDPADYWQEATATMSPHRINQHMHWHALPKGWEQLDYETFAERRRDLIAAVVKEGFLSLFENPNAVQKEATAAELAQQDESQTLEFKSTARWNMRANQADKKMEHVALKTVCGFLNAEGGKLIVGVDDDGNALGLSPDYSTLKKPDRDGFELWLRQHIENNLSIQTAKLVRVAFDTIDDKEVAVLTIAPSGRPVFAKGLGDQQPNDFWVRLGNQTKQLHGDEMIEYQQQHWH
ncbi:helix-turn-helix domain-containing protein, partial [Spectribacter hydrogenooxidans]